MNKVDQLISSIEDTTLEWRELSGYELFLLSHTKLAKNAAAEARRRLEAKGLQHTPWGWVTSKDLAVLGVVYKDKHWTAPTKEALLTWYRSRKIAEERDRIERNNATQASLKIDA